MVWKTISRVWSTSWWCEKNYDGVILKIDGVNKFFTVWSNLNGVIKRYFGVNKRPFFGNCVITLYGVITSHVFSWWIQPPGVTQRDAHDVRALTGGPQELIPLSPKWFLWERGFYHCAMNARKPYGSNNWIQLFDPDGFRSFIAQW
jgi:hypothetical protein